MVMENGVSTDKGINEHKSNTFLTQMSTFWHRASWKIHSRGTINRALNMAVKSKQNSIAQGNMEVINGSRLNKKNQKTMNKSETTRQSETINQRTMEQKKSKAKRTTKHRAPNRKPCSCNKSKQWIEIALLETSQWNSSKQAMELQ